MGKEGSTGQPTDSGAAFSELPPFSISAQGQDLTFYPAGPDRLERLLGLINGARESVRLCFYIFSEDNAGTAVRDALVEAARRGARVTLIIDGFGAEADEAFLQPLRDAGGTWHVFSSGWSQRYLIRNHQKLVIADGTAMLGGFNIADEYFAPPQADGWSDLGVTVEGSAVAQLARWFDELERWTADPKANWLAISRMIRDWDPGSGPGPTADRRPDAHPVELGACDPQGHCPRAAAGHDDGLFLARKPHGPPDRCLGAARRCPAGDGRQNRTIMPPSVPPARSMTYLLGCGAKVWEFMGCKLHTKLIVVDDTVYFGSANFDMRSLYVNLELMVRIEDAGLAERMRDFISHQIAASDEITPQVNKRRATLFNRIRWNVAWFLVTVVDYNVSRRLNLGLK